MQHLESVQYIAWPFMTAVNAVFGGPAADTLARLNFVISASNGAAWQPPTPPYNVRIYGVRKNPYITFITLFARH
jgi:hypothetical protein